MRRKAGGDMAEPGYPGASRDTHDPASGADPVFETVEEDLEPRSLPHSAGLGRGGDAEGALEIEFEDDDASGAQNSPAGRSRDLRPAALTALAAAVLGAALWATHGTAVPAAAPPVKTAIIVPPDYSAFVVTVGYQGSHLVSKAQRRIEVDLRVTPVRGAKVQIIAYYVSENGVSAHADPPPSVTPLPASGTDVKLDLTVTNCATVPIGESMGFVDVVADGPTGVIDRFTILGEQYSGDLANLLRQLCPGRSKGQDPSTIGVIVAGS